MALTTKQSVLMVIGVSLSVLLTVGFLFMVGNYKVYVVSGPAMEPTLKPAQRFVAARHVGTTKRGDIVIFNDPKTGRIGLLRVIALAGERIVISNSAVTVYNHDHPSGFDPDSEFGLDSTSTAGSIDVTLPADAVYVLGDNRTNSLDSRIIGPLKTSDIFAKKSSINL